MALPDESAVLDALRGVDDPEAGMNIVELGLVYAVNIGADRIDVDMTMTTPACSPRFLSRPARWDSERTTRQ